MTDTHEFETEVPELAEEFAARVVAGALKAARAFVPTRENLEGKKEHCNVPILNGVLYVGTDLSPYMATVQLRLAEMCKKRGELRPAIAAIEDRICAVANYGVSSPWLKLHTKNARSAYAGPDGLKLVVARGVVELDLALPPYLREYALKVKAIIESRVREDLLVAGPFPLPDGEPATSYVLNVDDSGVTYAERLVKGFSGVAQLKIKAGFLPKGESTVFVYEDPLGGRIVQIKTDAPTFVSNQYFRTLVV